ncbi:MAG: hypothetical protein ACC628_11450 [Pirellulaceae bacterium]
MKISACLCMLLGMLVSVASYSQSPRDIIDLILALGDGAPTFLFGVLFFFLSALPFGSKRNQSANTDKHTS